MFPQLTLRQAAARLGAAVLAGLLAATAAPAQTLPVVRLEAENATLVGTAAVLTDTPGYTGTGYVGDFSDAHDSLVFKFPTQLARYTLVVRYTSPTATKITSLTVNGVDSRLTLPKTADGFASVTAGTFILPAGTGRVAFGAGQGFYGIDYLELTPAAINLQPLTNGRLEAEDGQLNGVTVRTSPTGFSGTGYVWDFDNSDTKNVSMSFDNPTAGLYQLSVGYTSPYGLKVANVTVNGSKSAVTFTSTAGAADFNAADGGKVLLPAGLNTITIGGNYGYYGIDYVQLTPATVALPVKPAKQLSDPLATAKTKALFGYLVDQYGSKVLSGQQDDSYGRDGSEVAYVLATTGKEPAIVAMDLYDYSSSPVAAYGMPTNETERYLTWSSSGNGRGITSLIWHWRAPADLNNPNDPSGAFYTKNTTFNFAAALADTSGTRYHLLLKDIDLIAAQLQKFQDANVPVLWRPLHETPGTFFWWGNQGPAAFKQLWQLLYTRLTVRHQLHNLIWVYSANDLPAADWYPGDDYVDVTGVDIYQSNSTINPTANISSNWEAMQKLFAPRKLVAATEVGSLVNPDQVRGYATWWSWFGAWQGYYIRSQPVSFLKQVYNDADIITKDELPASLLATRANAAGPATSLQVFPNPTGGRELSIRVDVPGARPATVELCNALGQRVQTVQTYLPAGLSELQLPLTGIAPGIYQLVVRPAGQPASSRKVAVTW